MQRQWIFPVKDGNGIAALLRRELGIPEVTALMLLRNGLLNAETAGQFLNPRLNTLGDPNVLPDMPLAVDRLQRAITGRESIVLYGDYDVDGVSSLALLKRVLTACGALVECFLPMRSGEGYGLSPSGVARCFEEHRPTLLIAVDCGTNSASEIADIQRRGADVIVLDHHDPSSDRPTCTALVNPKLGLTHHYLCSAGVCFKLLHAFLKNHPHPEVDLKNYLDLVALGTVADLVPLVDENRIFVRRGLLQMASTHWVGLKALMKVSSVHAPLRGSDVGFRLGPRINASGRLGVATESLQLLLTNDPLEATRLADSLDRQNRERQDVERSLVYDVEKWVDSHYNPETDTSIVAGDHSWHHGVLGIVASRVMRKHHRPTFLIGFDADGIGRGSGRSIEGISLISILGECAGHLEKFGGHDMAAGLTIAEKHFENFRITFEKSARTLANKNILMPKLRLDAELGLDDLGMELLEMQQTLEPFGMANPQPVFALRSVSPGSAPETVKEKHLRVNFGTGRNRVQAIYFNGAETALPRAPWDVAFTVERNEFHGRVEAQMQIVAIRAAE